jgi:hypothetical protein
MRRLLVVILLVVVLGLVAYRVAWIFEPIAGECSRDESGEVPVTSRVEYHLGVRYVCGQL